MNQTKISLLLIFLISLIFISCSQDSKNPLTNRKEAEQTIKIDYEYGYVDRINTFENYCTKDLVLDGTISIEFWFQENEQDSIINIAEEIDFFNMPDTLKYIPEGSIITVINPDPGIQKLRINYNNKDKTVYWYSVNSFPEEFSKLKQLTNKIRSIVENDTEYLSLPEPNGGYL